MQFNFFLACKHRMASAFAFVSLAKLKHYNIEVLRTYFVNQGVFETVSFIR